MNLDALKAELGKLWKGFPPWIIKRLSPMSYPFDAIRVEAVAEGGAEMWADVRVNGDPRAIVDGLRNEIATAPTPIT